MVDQEKIIINRYLGNKRLFHDHLEHYNKTCNEMNQRIYNYLKSVPLHAIGKYNEDGEIEITSFDYDQNTKEIIKKLKQDNENTVKNMYPDLHIFLKYLNNIE